MFFSCISTKFKPPNFRRLFCLTTFRKRRNVEYEQVFSYGSIAYLNSKEQFWHQITSTICVHLEQALVPFIMGKALLPTQARLCLQYFQAQHMPMGT